MNWLKNLFVRLSFNKLSGNQDSVENQPRSEGGYFLVVFAIIGFVLVAGYLIGHRIPSVEKVEFSYLIEKVDQEISPQDAFAELNRGEFKRYNSSNEILDLGYMREGVWVLMKFSNRPESTASRYVIRTSTVPLPPWTWLNNLEHRLHFDLARQPLSPTQSCRVRKV
ncbi:hypothetical protein EBR21_01445 [bacterium]|nr:hypothetical protein [bacterium]